MGWVSISRARVALLSAVMVGVMCCAPAAWADPDVTAPTNPSLTSASHTVDTWSTDRSIDVAFSGAADDVGVDGYSYVWDTAADTAPDQVKDAEQDIMAISSPDLADGSTHWFHLVTSDDAGNWSAPVHLGPFKIDSAGPTPGVMSGSALSSGFVLSPALKLGWSSTDALSGISRYSVRYRRAKTNSFFGGMTVWKSVVADTSATLLAQVGATYCFSASGRDAAGNSGEWGNEKCASLPINDTALSTPTGGWRRVSNRGAYFGDFKRATRKGAQLQMLFAADQIALVATTCPTCGKVDVLIGYQRIARVSLRSAKVRRRQIVPVRSFKGTVAGRLTIKVHSSGKPVMIEGVGIRLKPGPVLADS